MELHASLYTYVHASYICNCMQAHVTSWNLGELCLYGSIVEILLLLLLLWLLWLWLHWETLGNLR